MTRVFWLSNREAFWEGFTSIRDVGHSPISRQGRCPTLADGVEQDRRADHMMRLGPAPI